MAQICTASCFLRLTTRFSVAETYGTAAFVESMQASPLGLPEKNILEDR
jgi:hypothetical protein